MKNIVVIPAIKPKSSNLDKFGGWSWMQYSITAWEYWCNQNNCELIIYDTPTNSDTMKHRVTWQRWFDVFNFLDKKNIQYDKILMTDACSIPKWDCPDFFELTDNKLTVGIENDNLAWVYEGVQGYRHMFDDYELDINKYFCSSFVIFNKSHRELFMKFKDKYMENADEFIFMVEAGMKPIDAILAATSVAAEVLEHKDLGKIKKRMKADIVAVDGNPLKDISVTKKVVFVMKDGVVYKKPK